jgi:hypothetical protein
MAKLSKIMLADKTYTFDSERILNVEYMAIEKETGWTAIEWEIKLNTGSVTAATALLWIILRRHVNPAMDFSEVEFDMSTLEIVLQDGKEDEAPKAPTDSPSTEVSSSEQLTLDV